ncbi:MAG: hypothetical protein AB8G05_02110 [Oligoflexales bacterium]
MACKLSMALLLAITCLLNKNLWARPINSYLKLYWGNCTLDSDPKAATPFSKTYAAICLKPELHQSMSHQQKTSHNQYYHYSKIYAGFHTLGTIGFHWSGFQKIQSDDGPGTQIDINRTTNTAALTIGKLGINRILLSAGKQKMGFGIGIMPKGAFIESINAPSFWDSPNYSLSASWDNLVDATAQVSIGIENPDELLFLEQELKQLSIASRLIYDSPAWFGTRFVISGLAHHNGERRFGIGMLNIAPNRAISLVEWIRSRQTPDGKSTSFKQLIRFTLIGEKQWNKQPFFMYDDVRKNHRLFAIGQEFFFYNNMSVRFSLAYRKDESSKREHLFYAIGGLSLQL